MNKLSKEQADWLIEKINELKFSHNVLSVNDNYEIPVKDFKELVNKCTEKEFPAFEMVVFCPESTNMFVDIPKDAEINIRPHVVTHEPTMFLKNGEIMVGCRFDFDEFKQFAEGCNKVVEWLEEKK